MNKRKIRTIYKKNRIITNIINAMAERDSFLICGHKDPDEDCISSMIAFALLLAKFDKRPQIYLDGYVPDRISYLLNICKYNSIQIVHKDDIIKNDIDTIVFCDTAKASMLDINKKISQLIKNKNILKIEIDHHIGGDGKYIGDREYSLVTDASSASELVGIIALKLRNRKDILERFSITDPFSRNFVLSIITGIVSDTNLGQYLKSKKELRYYSIFTNTYNTILQNATTKITNFNNIEDVFAEIHQLSIQEDECYKYIIQKKQFTKSIGYVILKYEDMEYINREYNRDIFTTVSRHAVNELAEESGKISLLAFCDNKKNLELVQFKMRRSYKFKDFDLRRVLDIFSISDGGGHEGAIGFRFPRKDIDDIEGFTANILAGIEKELAKL